MNHKIRAALFAAASLILSSSYIYIDDVMSEEEQQKTGIYDLDHNEKQELEVWLNQNFVLKNPQAEPSETPVSTLTFDMVIDNGKYVQLSDQSVWEICPDDISKTSVWLLPFPVVIKNGTDSNFPVILENQNTGESVKARKAPSNIIPSPSTTPGA